MIPIPIPHALVLAAIVGALVLLLSGLVWYALHPPYTSERARPVHKGQHAARRRGRRERLRQAHEAAREAAAAARMARAHRAQGRLVA